MSRHSRLKRNLVTSTLLLASALTGYGRRAYAAGCVSTGAPNYLCSGTNTTPLSVTANNATVTTDNTFSVYTGGGSAITVTGDGNLISFTDIYNSSITSTSNYGLNISATGNAGGAGGVLVDVNGSITGYSGGIHAVNHGSGGLSVTADGDVTTTNFGAVIGAYNYGNGLLSVTVNTDISTSGTGIVAFDLGSGGISITTAGITTGASGIQATNYGNGAMSITATGDVNAMFGNGIYLGDSYSSADISVNAGNVYSGLNAISVRQSGTGTMDITAGDVTGFMRGIDAGNNLYSGDMTITVDSANSMFTAGISAINNGIGSDLTITAGSASSTNGVGIFVFNNGGDDETINVGTATGYLNAIGVRDYGTGAATITATGDLSAYLQAISVRKGSGTDVTINVANVTSTGYFETIRAENSGTGALSITVGGDIVNTGTSVYSSGIFARNSGTDLMINATNVSAYQNGIDAESTGTGTLTITATGDVTVSNGYGISAHNHSGTDLTINAETVSGGTNGAGIYAQSYGTGALTINSGDVTGGISARSHNGTDLSISSGAISSVGRGIYARNYGAGSLVITAAGDVTSTLDIGVIATNYNGTDLSVTTGGVSSYSSGILASNHGTGILTVAANGDVTTSIGTGIYAHNFNGTDLTITAGTVSGQAGIGARNEGPNAGALTINANGNVTGTTYRGIDATNANTGGTDLSITAGAVSGGTTGIFADNYGAGALTITANGDVTGTSNTGIQAMNENNSGTDLSITAGAVSGGNYAGISAWNRGAGALMINTSGDVSGNTIGIDAFNDNDAGTDLSIITGAVTGGTFGGIKARNYGTGALSITANGDVTSATGSYGIFAENRGASALTVAVNGGVSGAYYGIFTRNYGSDLSVSTTGTISGYQGGITAFNNGTGALTINATGDVLGAAGYGVRAQNLGTDLSITTGAVTGGFGGGINARNFGAGATTVTATGDVTSASGNGIYALSFNYGTGVTVHAGNVDAFYNGIRAFNNGFGALKITAGDVTASYRYGIAGYNSGSATNLIITAGNVDGGSGGIKTINNGTGRTKITAGDVSAGFSFGIYAQNFTSTTTSIIIDAGAVSAGLRGVYAVNNGTGKIDITTTGDVSSTLLDAIYARNNAGTSVNITTGKVTASGIGGAGISARNYGAGHLSITATGDVTATGNNPYVTGDGIFARNAGTNLTIDVAKVSGYANGIEARNDGSGKLTIGVSGDVTGTTGSGISALQNGAGLFKIDVPAAVAIHGGTFGIYVAGNSGAGSPGIKTAGDITGDGGTAISLNNLTASTPIVVSGGTINGDVIDDNPANGFSPVSFTESFTTNGSFGVSGIEIKKGKILTVGSGDTLSANTFLFGIQNTSNFGQIAMTDTAFALSAPIAADDGQIAVNVTGSASLAGKNWKVVDGDGTDVLVNGPGSTLTQVVDNSALWDFDAADGTAFTGDNTDLFLQARNAGPGIAARGSSNSLNTLLSLGEVSDPQLTQVMGNVNSAPTTVALNNVLDATLPGVNGVDYASSLQAGEAADKYAKTRLAALRSGEGETGMAAGDSTMGLGVWGEFFGQHVDQGRRDGIAGYDANTWGGAVGVDSTGIFDNGTLGLAFSYGHTDADSDNANRTDTEVDNYQVSIYGDYNFTNRVYLNAMAGFTWGDVDTTRHNVSGTPGLTAHGDYNTQQFSAQAELGRGFAAGDSLTLTPNIMAHWVNWSPDSYTETGAGGANMHVNGDTLNKFEIGAGLKAGWSVKNGNGSLFRPELRAGYRYDLENDQVEDVAQFTGGGGSFSVPGPKPARGTVDVGGSLNFMTTNNWTFTASYDFNWKEDYTSHSGFLRAGYRF